MIYHILTLSHYKYISIVLLLYHDHGHCSVQSVSTEYIQYNVFISMLDISIYSSVPFILYRHILP